MKCEICQGRADGKFVIVEPKLMNSKLVVCEKCFHAWANQDYDTLTNRLKR